MKKKIKITLSNKEPPFTRKHVTPWDALKGVIQRGDG